MLLLIKTHFIFVLKLIMIIYSLILFTAQCIENVSFFFISLHLQPTFWKKKKKAEKSILNCDFLLLSAAGCKNHKSSRWRQRRLATTSINYCHS